jgi:hypothetical protein
MPRCKRLLKATAGERHGQWHGMCELTSSVSQRPWGPSKVRLLPATTRTFTKVVNQNAAAFGDLFICSDDGGNGILYGIWTNLKVKASLSSVMLRLGVFFFLLHVGNTSLKFSYFEIPILKYLQNFCLLLSDVQIPLPFLLLKTHYESNIFVLLALLLLKEGNAYMRLSRALLVLKKGKAYVQLSRAPHNYLCWRLSRIEKRTR